MTTVCRLLVGVTVRGSVRVHTRVTHVPTNAVLSGLIQVRYGTWDSDVPSIGVCDSQGQCQGPYTCKIIPTYVSQSGSIQV